MCATHYDGPLLPWKGYRTRGSIGDPIATQLMSNHQKAGEMKDFIDGECIAEHSAPRIEKLVKQTLVAWARDI